MWGREVREARSREVSKDTWQAWRVLGPQPFGFQGHGVCQLRLILKTLPLVPLGAACLSVISSEGALLLSSVSTV